VKIALKKFLNWLFLFLDNKGKERKWYMGKARNTKGEGVALNATGYLSHGRRMGNGCSGPKRIFDDERKK
jgi:hypothetical protein